MIKQQLRTNNVLDEQILSMFLEPTRSMFCPQGYQDFVYADMHIPLEHQQLMMTPLEESLILQTSEIKPDDMVLEIGTGSGFFSYLLSRLCQKVVSIDYYQDFVDQANSRFNELKVKNITCLHQDASQLNEFPYEFDLIICTAGLEAIPQSWLKLIKPHGKIFAPIGETTQNAQWIHLNNQTVAGHEFVFQTQVPMLIDNKPAKFIF
jgi:protein-L-isoaspartate(D-aspartate) O-methyltransferase